MQLRGLLRTAEPARLPLRMVPSSQAQTFCTLCNHHLKYRVFLLPDLGTGVKHRERSLIDQGCRAPMRPETAAGLGRGTF